MSVPVQVIVTAQTAQAAAAIKAFAANANQSLNGLTQSQLGMNAMIARGYDRYTQAQIHAVDAAYSSAARNTQALTGMAREYERVGRSAERAGTHLAGMAYYARGAADAVRYAAGGGGARAGYYALDEAFRGMLMSGAGVTTILSYIGAGLIALAPLVATGVEGWHAYKASVQAATDAQLEQAQNQSLVARNFKILDNALKEGRISTEDWTYVNKLLLIGTESANAAAVQMMRKLGLGGSEKNLVKLQALTRQMHEATMSQFDAERAKAFDNYQARFAEILKLKQAEGITVPAAAAASAAAVAEYNSKVAEIARRQNQKTLADEQKALQTTLLAMEVQAGDNRAGLADREYAAKIDALNRWKKAGILSTEDYTQIYLEAQKEREAGDKTEASEAEMTLKRLTAARAAQLKEIAARQAEAAENLRASINARISIIGLNPHATDREKIAAQLPLQEHLQSLNAGRLAQYRDLIANPGTRDEARLTAQKQMNQLLVQQAELQQKIADEKNRGNINYQMSSAVSAEENKWTTWAMEGAHSFTSVWDGAQSSISGGFTRLFEYGAQRGQWFRQIWNGIVGSIISSMVKMAVNWVMNHAIMTAATRAFHALETMLGIQSVAQHAAGETAKTTATAAGATSRIAAHAATAGAGAASAEAGIPYVGPVLAIAAMVAMVAAVMALAHGFAGGGRPEVGQLALVGERGPELFVPDTAGTIIPAHTTAAMMQGAGSGAASGAPGGGGAPSANISHYTFYDRSSMARHIERDDAHEKWVSDISARTFAKMKS